MSAGRCGRVCLQGKDTRTVHAGYMISALLGVVLNENNGRGTCGPGNEKRWWVVGEWQPLHCMLDEEAFGHGA